MLMATLYTGARTAVTAKRVEANIESGSGTYFSQGAAADVLASVAGMKLRSVLSKLGSAQKEVRITAYQPMIEFMRRAEVGLLSSVLQSHEGPEDQRISAYGWIRGILRGKRGEDPGCDEELGALAEASEESSPQASVGGPPPSDAAGAQQGKSGPRLITVTAEGDGYEVKMYAPKKKMRERDRKRMQAYIQRKLDIASKGVKDSGVGRFDGKDAEVLAATEEEARRQGLGAGTLKEMEAMSGDASAAERRRELPVRRSRTLPC